MTIVRKGSVLSFGQFMAGIITPLQLKVTKHLNSRGNRELDIAAPQTLRLSRSCRLLPSHRAMNTNRLYFALLSLLCPLGLQALDVNPELLRRHFATASSIHDIAMSGNYAYVAYGKAGARFGAGGSALGWLQIFDVRNPADPRPIGIHETKRIPQRLEISGSRAYVVVPSFGLQIIDVVDPSEPQHLADFRFEWQLEDLAVAGQYVYLAGSSDGLLVIDVNDSTNPLQVGSYDPKSTITTVEVFGSYALVGLGKTMEIVDISDPTNPERVSSYEVADGRILDSAISGGYAYLLVDRVGVEIIDLSDPANPQRAGGYAIGDRIPDRIGKLDIAEQYLYLARADKGLDVIDISDPSNPQLVGSFAQLVGSFGGNVGSVRVAGDRAFIAMGFLSSFAVLDISQNEQPLLMGSYAEGGVDPRDFVINGHYGYVADALAGLVVFDLSPVDGPIQVSSYFLGSPAENLAIMENHALLTSDNLLHVIDISDPEVLLPVGSFESEGTITDIAVSERHAYVTERPRWNGVDDVGGGLRVIDLDDPAQPTQVGSYGKGIYANSLAIAGGYAYLADGNEVEGEGLAILDIDDPTDPILVAGHRTVGSPRGVVISGNHAYLISERHYVGTEWQSGGIEVIDIANPAQPHQVGFYEDDDSKSRDIHVFPRVFRDSVSGRGVSDRGLHFRIRRGRCA